MVGGAALVLQAWEPVATLTGFASLPADTLAAGPPAGRFMRDGWRGDTVPLASQPVLGFSSIAPAGDGWWWALADNGFGTRLNSSDFLLRIYRVRPVWRERTGEVARVDVDPAMVQFADPDGRVPFRIVREGTTERLLTGGDFDPESLVVMSDGSFWIGDEFGPFLLHVDRHGRLLEPPVEAPRVRSPDHPLLAPADRGATSAATVGRSQGFEGLSRPPGSDRLLALLESGTAEDPPRTTRIIEYEITRRAWTGRTWTLALEQAAVAATELVCYRSDVCLVIERDDRQGSKALVKFVMAVGLPEAGGAAETGFVADLLGIADPQNLGGFGFDFKFPFKTPEAVWPLGDRTLVLVNDNNFPATGGRRDDTRDDSEFIRMRLASALP
jgi:glycerophosphoryl diester phosphodiesterase